jgi:tetrahydromethanopterin S-methyltransferase subunit B
MAAQSDRLNEPLLLLGEQITQQIRREMAGLREELKGDMTDMAKNMERLRKQMKKLNRKVDDMQFSMHSEYGAISTYCRYSQAYNIKQFRESWLSFER